MKICFCFPHISTLSPIGIKDWLMKKCILMFALLVLTLVVAILMEKDYENIPDQEQLLSENNIENILPDNDKFW